MRTNLEHREEQFTLARIHAVLCPLSAGMIGQIASANPITPHLHSAVWYFGASILLNAFFYVLETDPDAPRCKSRLWSCALIVLNASAMGVALAGVALVVGHFSPLAGLLFSLFGVLLWAYLGFVHYRTVRAQADAYSREADEFMRQGKQGMRQWRKIKREYDKEVRRQTTGESADSLSRRQKIVGRLEEKSAELKRLSVEHSAILDPRKAEVDRLLRKLSLKVLQSSKN